MKALLTVLLALSQCVAFAGPAHPNVILLFIDDMGWGDFSCFGNPDAQTPNIDRIAKEGLSFDQFYVNSPICSPSRVAITTGQYPQRWKITSYLAYRAQNQERGMANWLDTKAPSLARSLQGAGYATGHFGKWHMGGQRDVADAPEISEYGFDVSLTNFEGMGPKLLPLITKEDGSIDKIWADAEGLGGSVTWMQRSEITGGFVDAAIPFMKNAHEGGKPFYVNIWPDDVHSPYWPSLESIGKSEGSKRALYLSVLEEMDRQLGKLFAFVSSDESLRETTLILICSDNGPEKGAGSAGKFRGYKTQLFEGGIRSPLIAWGPGLLAQEAKGTRDSDSAFAAIDLVPSLLALTGTSPVDGVAYDVENLSGTLLGKSPGSRKAPIFFSRPPDRKSFYGTENLPDLAMREGKWKLLCDYDGSRQLLFDLDSDPGEKENLADRQPAICREMSVKLLKWHKSVP